MKRLAHVASRFINTPLMIHPPKLEVIIRALGPRLGIDPDVVLAQRVPMDATATLMARYGEAGDDRDYAVIDGIAVIPVQGTLLKKESFMSAFSGATSYEQIERQVASAVDDAGVLGILLDIDSPGGETAGCFELSDYLYSIRGVKPVFAAANDVALSAAYALASAANRVFVTRTGALGSVGVYALHVDQSGFDKAIGAKYTYIFAGDKKVEGNPHEPLAKGAKDDIQAEVDREYGIFTETVARNRDADKKEIVATQAGVVWADNALPLFGDEVGTLDDAMAALRQVVGKRGISMAAPAAISRQGDHGMKTSVLALAPDGGDAKIDQPIGAGKEGCDPDKGAEPDAKKKTPEPDGKGTTPEPGDKKPEPDDEDEDEKDGKKAAAAPLVLVQGEPLTAVRGEADIKAIGALCKLAGCPERAPEYLTAKTKSGSYLSVADISEMLTSERVAESERHMINSSVDPHKTGIARMQDVESEAVAFARQNRGAVMENLYVPGQSRGVTKEQAVARMLEAHPEAYAAFRNEHNGAALVATLQKAGYEIVRR